MNAGTYRIVAEGLTLGDAQVALSRLRQWSARIELTAPEEAVPAPRRPVPFRLVRCLDTAEIRVFGGYVGRGRFIAADMSQGLSDEELVADWEPIDGHGGMVDWPEEG